MTRFLFSAGAVFLLAGVVCLDARQGARAVRPQPEAQPAYAGGKLARPANYPEWVFLSSGLGMSYNATAGGPELFTNTFVPQWAYREFLATGKWPEKSMFVLEERSSENKGSIVKTGHFQSDLQGLAVEVKDSARFADHWAYFSFGGAAQTATAMTGPKDACWQCHENNAAVEHTFVQFYPTLKPVAEKFGTYRQQVDQTAPSR
jgi:Cytochrome P460